MLHSVSVSRAMNSVIPQLFGGVYLVQSKSGGWERDWLVHKCVYEGWLLAMAAKVRASPYTR